MPSPRTTGNGSTEEVSNKPSQRKPANMIAAFFDVIRVAWLLLGTKVITSVANAMSATVFPLVLKDIYQQDEKSLGYAMSAMSAFNGVVSGFLLGPIVSTAGGKLTTVITLCIFFMGAFSVAIAIVGLPTISAWLAQYALYTFLGLTFALGMFQFVLSTTVTGESTAIVKPTEKGTLLGLEHSLFAAARVVAPQSGVLLLAWGGLTAVSMACSGIFFTVLSVWSIYSPTLEHAAKLSTKTEGERKER
jgi:MFS family permease